MKTLKRFLKIIRALLWLRIAKPVAAPKLRRARRVCAKCDSQIRKHHKWHFNDAGRAEHRYCEIPTSYGPAEPPAATVQQELPGAVV